MSHVAWVTGTTLSAASPNFTPIPQPPNLSCIAPIKTLISKLLQKAHHEYLSTWERHIWWRWWQILVYVEYVHWCYQWVCTFEETHHKIHECAIHGFWFEKTDAQKKCCQKQISKAKNCTQLVHLEDWTKQDHWETTRSTFCHWRSKCHQFEITFVKFCN